MALRGSGRLGLAVLVILVVGAAAAPAATPDLDTFPIGRPLCFGMAPTLPGGSAGNDTLYGTRGNDVIIGYGGNDTIYGKGGHDRLCGGEGRDVIYGGPGHDRISGGAQRDELLGGEGVDTLDGGADVDLCHAGETYLSCERPTLSQIVSDCPTAAEVAAIDADLAITFDANPTAGILACWGTGLAPLSPLEKRAYNAVRMMQRLSFDAPFPWTDLSLYDWFVASIDGIRFRDDITYSQCCDPAGVVNIKTGWPLPASQATDQWIPPDSPVGLAQMMILMVHEARHNNGYPHTCDADDDGMNENDDTLAQMGSWAVQYYLQLWLADHTSATFMRAPIAGDPSYYQDSHRQQAQAMLYPGVYFCGL